MHNPSSLFRALLVGVAVIAMQGWGTPVNAQDNGRTAGKEESSAVSKAIWGPHVSGMTLARMFAISVAILLPVKMPMKTPAPRTMTTTFSKFSPWAAKRLFCTSREG